VDWHEPLRLAMSALQQRNDVRETAIEAVFELIVERPRALDRAALQAVLNSTRNDPLTLKGHVSDTYEHEYVKHPSLVKPHTSVV
jgi:hypothetical protein